MKINKKLLYIITVILTIINILIFSTFNIVWIVNGESAMWCKYPISFSRIAFVFCLVIGRINEM